MKLLIIGAQGQLGSDLMAAATARAGIEPHGLDRPEIDVCDLVHLTEHISHVKPEAIINCAAFHEVDRCETEADAAFAVNVGGVLNLARICKASNIKLVTISSDYVFHESADRRPFTEADRPDPRSVYAISKHAGEQAALAYCPGALIVRPCGLYGVTPPAGKAYNFPEVMLKLAKKGQPIRVVDDQICTPTWTQPLAEQIFDALSADMDGILHATCQGQCSWYDFARAVFELSGVTADLSPISTEAYGLAAPRPPFSVLDNARLRAAGLDRMPPWRDALAEYLIQRAAR